LAYQLHEKEREKKGRIAEPGLKETVRALKNDQEEGGGERRRTNKVETIARFLGLVWYNRG